MYRPQTPFICYACICTEEEEIVPSTQEKSLKHGKEHANCPLTQAWVIVHIIFINFNLFCHVYFIQIVFAPPFFCTYLQ